MLTKQQALDHGITEDMLKSAEKLGYVLRRVIPQARWELAKHREERRKLIRHPIKMLVQQISNVGHEDSISVTVDEIMEALDVYVEEEV